MAEPLDAFEVSAVIPAYNEKARLAPTLAVLADYFGTRDSATEVLVVDDGSTDGTIGVAEKFADRFRSLVILRHAQNRGKGAAVRTGMLAARGRIRFFYDADGSTPIEELDRALAHHAAGADIVIGSRSLPESNRAVRQPLHRHLAGAVFRSLVWLLAVPGFRDTQCGFKSFTADAARRLFPLQRLERFGFDVELLFLARRLGLSVVEMPVTWRDSKDTRLSFFRDGIGMILDLLRVRRNQFLGRYRLPQ